MSIRVLLFSAIMLFSFFHNAYAEQRIDIGKYMTINKSDDLGVLAWKLRIDNYRTIGYQKAINDFILWCTYETRKKENVDNTPCEIYAQEVSKSESDVIGSIEATKILIGELDKEPRVEENTEHLVVLKDQLDQMEKLPVLHRVMDAMKDKQ